MVSEGSGGGLLKTKLYDWHCVRGAKMVPFAGYEMPLHYEGIRSEHLGTRRGAGFFDVSHMGQLRLVGLDGVRVLERVVGASLGDLRPGKWCYTQILNEEGGIEDDLLVGRDDREGSRVLHLVVNASRKHEDALLIEGLIGSSDDAKLKWVASRSLIAVQGPGSCEVLSLLWEGVEDIPRMGMRREGDVLISRTGYTGNDGFEISLDDGDVEEVATILAEDERLTLCGLGSRNSLRLEAGMCLYGHDIDEGTTPVEAGLAWSLGRDRSGYRGYEKVRSQLEGGVEKMRVGLLLGERSIVRDGAKIYDEGGLEEVGYVTSGSFSPSLGVGIGMGYVGSSFSEESTLLKCDIRGTLHEARVVRMPFLDHLR